STPIVGQTVSFDLGGGDSCSALTDASGDAKCPITPSQAPGQKQLAVSFSGDGDGDYNASGVGQPFTENPEDTQIVYRGAIGGHYHDTTTVGAFLLDASDGSPIAGKTLTFSLGGGDSCSQQTDSSGHASCPLTPHQAGGKTLTVSFATDGYYQSASTSKPFSVTPEEATVSYTGPTLILAGASGATLTGTMVEDGANDSDA